MRSTLRLLCECGRDGGGPELALPPPPCKSSVFTLCEHCDLTLSCSTHHEETEVWSPVTHTGQEHNFTAKFMFFQKYKLE